MYSCVCINGGVADDYVTRKAPLHSRHRRLSTTSALAIAMACVIISAIASSAAAAVAVLPSVVTFTLTKSRPTSADMYLQDLQEQRIIYQAVAQTRHSPSSVASLQGSPLSSMPNHQRQRKRHTKRNSNSFDFNVNSTILEWVNPCGGNDKPTDSTRRVNRLKVYKRLKRVARLEYNQIKVNPTIEKNLTQWEKHKKNYQFLPEIKLESNCSHIPITLKRWYKEMRTFIGAITYLFRMQRNWEHEVQQQETVSRNLFSMVESSKALACKLEYAINNTHPGQPELRRIPHVTRDEMNKKLRLKTMKNYIKTNTLQEADPIDLLYVNYRYFKYVENMFKLLRNKVNCMTPLKLKQRTRIRPHNRHNHSRNTHTQNLSK